MKNVFVAVWINYFTFASEIGVKITHYLIFKWLNFHIKKLFLHFITITT